MPAFLIGGFGIAIGLMLLGPKVMETIGKNIIKLDYQKGYSTQFAAGISVCLGSILGVPLSTTHCVLGALAGVYFAGKTSTMLVLYPNA